MAQSQRWYLIDPRDGYPLGGYDSEAEAKFVRSVDRERWGQVPRQMRRSDAEAIRRRLMPQVMRNPHASPGTTPTREA